MFNSSHFYIFLFDLKTTRSIPLFNNYIPSLAGRLLTQNKWIIVNVKLHRVLLRLQSVQQHLRAVGKVLSLDLLPCEA